jgi:hypothetical protein
MEDRNRVGIASRDLVPVCHTLGGGGSCEPAVGGGR